MIKTIESVITNEQGSRKTKKGNICFKFPLILAPEQQSSSTKESPTSESGMEALRVSCANGYHPDLQKEASSAISFLYNLYCLVSLYLLHCPRLTRNTI
jgi:hypothetical protein